MNILITGGSGFIGSRLIRHLRNHHQITVLTRNPRHALQRIGFDIHALASLKDPGITRRLRRRDQPGRRTYRLTLE